MISKHDEYVTGINVTRIKKTSSRKPSLYCTVILAHDCGRDEDRHLSDGMI